MKKTNRLFSLFLAALTLIGLFPVADASAASQTLPSGTYYIVSALDSNKVLDIYCMGTHDGANAQIYQLNNCGAQIFNVTYKNGHYVITNAHSGKALDVQGGNTASGTNVWQYTVNGTNAQKWYINWCGDGYWSIKAHCGKYLDVSGGSSANDTNVQIWEGNGSKAQKWRFVPVNAPVEEERYTITSALDSGKALDISGGSIFNKANLQLYKKNNSGAQLFKIDFLGNGYCKIINTNSGRALTVANGSNQSGANVYQYTNNNSNTSMWWYLMPCGDGYYNIINKNGLYLDVSGASTKNGTNIQVYTGNATKAQKFKLEPYVKYTYTTVTYNCKDLETWKRDMTTRSILPYGADGVVVAAEVLQAKTIKVYNPQTRRNVSLQLPYKVRYKVHYHEYNRGFGRSWYYTNNGIQCIQTCNCGLRQEGVFWEFPDLTEMGSSQTTASVISNLPKINK